MLGNTMEHFITELDDAAEGKEKQADNATDPTDATLV